MSRLPDDFLVCSRAPCRIVTFPQLAFAVLCLHTLFASVVIIITSRNYIQSFCTDSFSATSSSFEVGCGNAEPCLPCFLEKPFENQHIKGHVCPAHGCLPLQHLCKTRQRSLVRLRPNVIVMRNEHMSVSLLRIVNAVIKHTSSGLWRDLRSFTACAALTFMRLNLSCGPTITWCDVWFHVLRA